LVVERVEGNSMNDRRLRKKKRFDTALPGKG
jgi:hypothetical protein